MGVYKRGKVWWIDYYYQGRRVREPVGTSKKQANAALKARSGEVAQGKFDLAKVKSTPAFEEFSKVYIEYAKVNKRSWKSDVNSLKHLIGFFGTRRLSEISPFLIEKYKHKRRESVKPATVNRELACLKHMLNLAIKWSKAVHNPMHDVKLFQENNTGLRYLTEDEITKLISYSSDHLRPILITAVYTGMRQGEILALTWPQIDFKAGLITIERTKSGEPRKIPMNAELTRTLHDITLRCDKKVPYVFCSGDGKPYGSVKRAFGTLRKRLLDEDFQYFRFHDLRHTFASHLVMNGVDLVTVKELLGHKTIKMTMRYAHLSQDHKRRAVDSLKGLCAKKDGHNLVTITKKRKFTSAVTR